MPMIAVFELDLELFRLNRELWSELFTNLLDFLDRTIPPTLDWDRFGC